MMVCWEFQILIFYILFLLLDTDKKIKTQDSGHPAAEQQREQPQQNATTSDNNMKISYIIISLITAFCMFHSVLCRQTSNRLYTRLFSAAAYDDFGHRVLSESVVFPAKGEKAWRKIIRKEVMLPNKKTFNFDVLSQGHPSILVFVWDTKTKTTTLIKEYQPGPNSVLYGTVAGMYESNKHDSPLQCAQYELEEEAHLTSNTWIPLLQDAELAIPFDKYSDNKFYMYLALDCSKVPNPRSLDEAEYIVIENSVTYLKLLDIIKSGKMNVASSFAALLALQKLKEDNLLT